jgi:hypothetical protein
MNNRQQLAGTARSHKIVHLLLRVGKLIEALGIDHNDRERIQSLGFVDRKERQFSGLSIHATNKRPFA